MSMCANTHFNKLIFLHHRVPFSRATDFANEAQKGVHGNNFHKMTLAVLFTIHVHLHAMEFPLIFGETNFVKVLKIREICEIYAP